MTTMQDSELLTRVGPGTPMGNLMRHYWLPALKSSELKPDGDPVRLKLLGEELIAFRDTSGRIGVMDHRCPHRCASLFYGRNEEDGIRCIYHGWKYDVDGHCLDQPNLPPHQQFTDKIHAKAYKAAERNGVVYVYMGAADKAPPLPDIAATHIPESEAKITFAMRECNWLQALEGDIDTSHLNFLHYGAASGADFAPTDRGALRRRSGATPNTRSSEHELGTIYGAYRPGRERHDLLAHRAFPVSVLDAGAVHRVRALPHRARLGAARRHAHDVRDDRAESGTGLRRSTTERVLPNTTDWLGRYRLRAERRRTIISSTARRSARVPTPASRASISRIRPSPKAWARSPTTVSSISPPATAWWRSRGGACSPRPRRWRKPARCRRAAARPARKPMAGCAAVISSRPRRGNGATSTAFSSTSVQTAGTAEAAE